MHRASREKLQELHHIISKMPLNVCWVTVLPEFGVQWRQVSSVVRNNRLPMVPASVAKVLCRHAAKSMPEEELSEIAARLRLKLIATQERKWYVIDLQDPIEQESSVAETIRVLPQRVSDALKKNRGGRSMSPEILTVLLGDLLYMSVQMVSENKEGPVLYLATPPGEPVALVSSLTRQLLKSCVQGLGYNSFEDAQLSGRDIKSLLRIHNRNHNENVDHLAGIPEYNPTPVITNTGIDFTHHAYNTAYVDNLLGPDPPLLTELTITCQKPFFDPSRINKKMSLSVKIDSEDVAKTLKAWAEKGAVAPTSDFFHIFPKVKSNKIMFDGDDETLE